MALVPCSKSEPRVEFPLHTLDSLAGCLVIISTCVVVGTWCRGSRVGADPPPRLNGERPRARGSACCGTTTARDDRSGASAVQTSFVLIAVMSCVLRCRRLEHVRVSC